MTISELSDDRHFKFLTAKKPAFILVISADGTLYNKNGAFKADLTTLGNLNVRNYTLIRCSDRASLEYVFSLLFKKPENEHFASCIANASTYCNVLTIVVPPVKTCVVVTEQYFNDGSHNTFRKIVPTDPSNLSDSFSSDEYSDTFTTVFENDDAALNYLLSSFYSDLVVSRVRNRLSKFLTNVSDIKKQYC